MCKVWVGFAAIQDRLVARVPLADVNHKTLGCPGFRIRLLDANPGTTGLRIRQDLHCNSGGSKKILGFPPTFRVSRSRAVHSDSISTTPVSRNA